MVHGMTTNDNEWCNKWQRVATSGTTGESEWQRVTTNDNQWQRVAASGTTNETAQYTSKNGWLASLLWQKQIHYFKFWMTANRVVK